MKTKTFLLSLFLPVCILIKAQVPSAIQGNWINNETNDWEYGFFNQLAIYNCDRWEYSAMNEKGKKTFITLQNKNNSLQLEITSINDSIIQIKTDKKKAKKYRRLNSTYPAYPVYNNQPFASPAFCYDSVTIKGYYHNFDKIPEGFLERIESTGRKFFSISVPDFIKESETKYVQEIDSTGYFTTKIQIMNPQIIEIHWGWERQQFVVEPKDTLFIFADIAAFLPDSEIDRQIVVMGTNARVNNEILSYNPTIEKQHEDKKEMSDMEYLRTCEDAYTKKLSYFNDHLTSYPNLSEKFRFYSKTNETYAFAGELMAHRFKLSARDDKTFEDGYIEYVDQIFTFNDENLYTFTKEYKYFLEGYINYKNMGQDKFISYTVDTIIDKLEKEGKLNDKLTKLITDYQTVIQQIELTPDSVEKVHIYESSKLLISELYSHPVIKKASEEFSAESFFEMSVAESEPWITDKTLKDLWFTYLYTNTINYHRVPLNEGRLLKMNNRINNPYLKSEVINLNNYYIAIENTEMKGEESLKNTSHLAEVFDADKIFNELIDPYKGKVIYIDFWGTWCKPCIEYISLMPEIKESLKEKDIIYMYFAAYSPESSWRNFIKEKNLTGENIVHYCLPGQQQDMIQEKFSIRSFPTYMIVNKKGEVINTQAPGPNNKNHLIQELENALQQ